MDISFEIVQALKSIARAKDVDEDLIIETLQAGLISAARKKFGPESRITVDIDEELSKLTVYCTKDVVKEIEKLTGGKMADRVLVATAPHALTTLNPQGPRVAGEAPLGASGGDRHARRLDRL